MNRILLIVLLLIGVSATAKPDDTQWHTLKYAPSPVYNPLKGFVPWVGDLRDKFPHSMEFSYLPLSALLVGKDEYDWKILEELLEKTSSRGHQAIFRIYLEYPGHADVIPHFLINGGLKVYKNQNTNTQPLPPAEVVTPDYEDKNLRDALVKFIGEMGKKYDGDARIGFIDAALLGTWGEWHTSPKSELFASKKVQAEIMDAYASAFKITPIVLRFPAGEVNDRYASNATRDFGYSDDSFAWATLDTGKKGEEWFFMSLLKAAGSAALAKWKTSPIGGEVRPEAWESVFNVEPVSGHVQDFKECVEKTHVSWLMNGGYMFVMKQGDVRRARAIDLAARMGYEFHVVAVKPSVQQGAYLPVVVELENRGVAPFYYDWPVEYGLIAGGKVAKVIRGKGKLTGILPGDVSYNWNERLDVTDVAPGEYKLALRVLNPLSSGHPLRFANQTQDAELPTWLTLSTVHIE